MSKTIGLILSLSDKCSPQLSKVAEKLNLTDKEAKKLHKEITKLSKDLKEGFKKAATACAVGFGAVASAGALMTKQAIEAGDRIDKMSQKMQMSRKTFQELDYVFSQNGADIEIMQIAMSKLAKTMEGARTGNKSSVKTFQQLGISLKDVNGHFKTSEEVMFEVFSRLQKMPESATKSALALSIFGKSASELAPLLNGNAKSVDELRKRFAELGMGLSDKQIDSAVRFKDTMDTIQRTFASLGNQIGADLLPTLQSVADSLIENMPQIKAVVVPVLTGIINATKLLIDNMNFIIPVATAVLGTFAAFKTITAVVAGFNLLTSAITAVSVAGGVMNAIMLANPFGLIAVAIGAVIGIVTALEMKFHLLSKAANKFKEIFSKIKGQFAEQNQRVAESQGGTVAVPVPKYAGGTNYASGGLSLVGERGPELVNLPRGSKVLNNSDTQKALGNNITVNLNIGGSVISEGELINKISNVLGRQLQTALQC